MGRLRIRTDLALEATERFKKDHVEIRGVEISESYNKETDIRTTLVKISSENGAKAMGRPQGNYITIEADNLGIPDEGFHEEVSQEIARQLKKLIDLEKLESVLVVGLGNVGITSDSLGPHVVEHLHVNRHIIREYGIKNTVGKRLCQISAVAPGVMAQTGMETSEIILGITEITKPDLIIAIDALAARSIKRLNRTIQIADTGIHPGSGVGNHRSGITGETMGVKVIGIGVPTVVDAATIVYDSVTHLLEVLEEREQQEFLEEMVSPGLYGMFVTPKDVDETIRYLSYTISEGLHMALE